MHERFVADEIGRLLDAVAPLETELEYDSDDASLIRVTRRDWEKERRVPAELPRVGARGRQGHVAWLEARESNDFGVFLPAFRRVHDVALRWAEHMEQGDSPYDAFLDEYEPGMKTAEVKAVFDVLRPELTALVRDAGEPADDSFLEGRLPGRDAAGVLAGSCATSASRRARTARPDRASVRDLVLGHRHPDDDALPAGQPARALVDDARGGHGLSYRGIDARAGAARRSTATPRSGSASRRAARGRTSSAAPAVLARPPPRAAAALPAARAVDLDTWYRGINRVAPGLIRVEADEVTYSLHIILRFELEQELVAGTLDPADLPEAWNARMHELLGVEVPDDLRGVLQDVHWTRAALRLLPDLRARQRLSVQIWRRWRRSLPDLDAQLEAGEFGPLYESLRARLYRHGRKFTPMETLERAIGATAIDPQPYLAYLRGRSRRPPSAPLEPPRPQVRAGRRPRDRGGGQPGDCRRTSRGPCTQRRRARARQRRSGRLPADSPPSVRASTRP